jgi:Abnormal spindle-like microcephaly-assoc'd, ASPM-SPD-2-Hydin
MSKNFRCSQFAFAMAVLLVAVTAAWADNVVQVSSQADLGPDSSISWTQLGGDQTQLAASFNVNSNHGLSTGVTLAGPHSVVSVVCALAPPLSQNCSWNGSGFTAGDSLLWTTNAFGGGNSPVTLTFASGIIGAGALLQSDVPGQFTASIQAFNGGTSLGTFTAQSDASGDALYLGVKDNTGANITSIVYSLTACAATCADFAVDAVDLATGGAAQNFSLSANPTSVTITQGSSGTSTITITPSNGFSGSVTLSASGLPSGVTALFNPNPATTSSLLTLTASATAATGTSPLTISGTSGSLTNTTPLSLTVNPVTSATLIASPSSVSFGNVVVGRPKKQVVTLTNTGITTLNIGPITLTVTQGDASQFSLGHVCPPHLKPGRSCNIAVHFTPDAVGSDAATLNIVSSAPGSPLEVPITGAGINK